ncbi:MAG: PTS sugar transporter subunit IIA [Parachlamydiales bacterium]
MDLKIADVAKLLHVSEEAIERLLKEEKIPSYRIQDEVRFNRSEVEAWMMEVQVDQEGNWILGSSAEPDKGMHKFSLYRALNKGEVYDGVAGGTKEVLIRAAVAQMAPKFKLDAEGISGLLLDRERLMPTALNHGIALPHTRDFLLDSFHDVVAVVYPAKPIEYGALDGQPVHTLFFLFACSDKRHLDLLSKVAHFCNEESHRQLLLTRPNRVELLARIREWEGGLKRP